MISKEYHHMINLGIVSNFYISIDHVYPGSYARGSAVVVELRNLGSIFSIGPGAHFPQ